MPIAGRRLSQLQHLGVAELESVRPRKRAGLHEMGIDSVLDLLTHYPRRYVDRTNEAEIAGLEEGDEAVVTAEVVRGSSRRLRNGRTLAEILVRDRSGVLVCTFFNQPWQARRFEPGQIVTVFGKVALYRGRRQMANPVVDLVGDQTGRIVPIYRQSGKAAISSIEIGRYVDEALQRAGAFADPLPETTRAELDLVTRTEAFRAVHQPKAMADKDPARRRLAFDELLRLQLLLVSRRRAADAASNGIAHHVAGALLGEYLAKLPFELTSAQHRAIEQISADLASPRPMNRLLQGDVGAGKTVVALAALLVGVEGGYQGAFMVPTEVLAEQHYLSAGRLLAGLVVPDAGTLSGARPLAVGLLTNRTSGAERTKVLRELATGGIDLVVGTHALLFEGVEFRALGVVVVDEQHRFGVEQRAALAAKAAADPDLLVMTATPIPRTAAMTVYGDLDHSVVEELPAGRSPIETRWLQGERREETAWKQVRREVAAGHQAFVVCPLVGAGRHESGGEEPDDPDAYVVDEEDEEARDTGDEPLRLVPRPTGEVVQRPVRSAIEERERLAAGPLAGLRVGLLHGQMATKEKEPVMADFRAGEIDVLVSTTVVEVGVDVANATVMVIEDADRFGVAQLHQLRGRVGRADLQSWCYLLTSEEVTEPAALRLAALVRSQDGFELAEVDLALRREGTVLGARQKGRTDLKIANLQEHRDLVFESRRVAGELIDGEDRAEHYALLQDEVAALVTADEAEFLFRG
jgi:ATP-dependent DNA helicase RecG